MAEKKSHIYFKFIFKIKFYAVVFSDKTLHKISTIQYNSVYIY